MDSFTTKTEPVRPQINIYTDGNKTDEHTGCGFTISRYNNEIAADSVRLPDYLAMIEVRQHLKEED